MPLTLSGWLSDRPLILDLFTNSVSGFRSWERNDYIFIIPKWHLGKCHLRGRSHWSSPLLLPCPILNNLLFIYLVYTHKTQCTHTHNFPVPFSGLTQMPQAWGGGAPMGTGSSWDGFPILTSMSSAARQSPKGWPGYCEWALPRPVCLGSHHPLYPACGARLPGLSAKSPTNCIAGVSCFG